MVKVLIIGASGRVGSQIVKELDADHEGVTMRLATSRPRRLSNGVKKVGRL